jgi:hypothetical protein
LLPSGKFENTAEGKHLKGACNRNGETSIPSSRDVREFGSIQGDVARETDASSRYQISNNTKLADTAVLDLNTTEAVELFLVAIGNKAKGIKEAKWRF